jgi:SAM-dependent methyltransferase
MFVPNPPRAAAEMLRVTKPGGKIGLANWHPDGFIGGMFKIIGGLVPPPAGISSPMQWGVEAKLQELFAGARVEVTTKQFTFRYRSAQEMFETFRDFYGPTVKAWAALDDAGKAALEEQLVAHMDAHNRRTDGALAVDSDYVEVVVTTS